ncbi:MAG: cadherin-like domain-containing protein, partial [Mariniblastus sp.]
DDTFVYAQGDGADRMLGGEGTDRVDATSASSLGLQHMVAKDSIEVIEGSEEGTRIEGTERNNHLDFTNTELKNVTEIDAGAGNDRVKGSQADDVIIGGTGNDNLYGNAGDDTFVYAEGDGNDRMRGGEGTDTIDASQASTLDLTHITAGDSIEAIEGSAEGTRIEGTDGNNHLNFTNTELTNIKEIDAGAGNDRVYGSQADDVIIGGEGNDTLYGNAGDDTFVYAQGDGADRMLGGEGTDRVDATSASSLGLQHMVAKDSIEVIEGSEEGTRIEGTERNNHLDFTNTELYIVSGFGARAGKHPVHAPHAADVIIGGTGNDNLYGNAGDDTFVYAEGDGNDRMRGGEGIDRVDATSANSLGLQHMVAKDSIEVIEGSEEGTRIEGTERNNHLDFTNTELKNVTEIDAGAGNDRVKGSQADDVIIGGTGNDTLYGNAGDDTFVYAEGDGADRMLGGEGTDTIDATEADTLSLRHLTSRDSIETINGSENGTSIEGTDGNNHLNFSNTELNNIVSIDAGAGDDYVLGTSGDDVFIAGEGNDRYVGNGGNDVVLFDGNRADYEITKLSDGSFEVQDMRDGADGRDVVQLIENFQFADGHANVDDVIEFKADSLQMAGGSVVENSAAGVVVATFGADDSFGESHTYEIVDAEGNVLDHPQFEVVANQIVVKADADLNFEEVNTFDLQVRSTSTEGVQYSTSLAVDVIDINEAPTVLSFSSDMQEDGTFSGNLLSGSSDEDGDTLEVVRHSQPEHGTVVVNADGEFTYQPSENFSGSDMFTYQVSDGNGGTATETVSIEIAAVADGVELEPAELRGQEDEPIALDFGMSLIDGDGSETVSEVVIRGIPTRASLSAGDQLEDGSWKLSAEELVGLELQLNGFGNEDLQLTIDVTTQDGDDSITQTKIVSVAVLNDTLNTNLAFESQNTSTADRGSRETDQTTNTEFEPNTETFAQDEPPARSDFNGFSNPLDLDFNSDSDDQSNLWDEAEWEQFSRDTSERSDAPEATNSEATNSNEVASVDENYLKELNQLEFFDPTQLVSSEAVAFENGDLQAQPIQIEDWEAFDFDMPVESLSTQNLTTASLLMFFTTREDSRVKLKSVKSLKEEEKAEAK